MIRLDEKTQVYIATSPVDGRKAINGLSALVVEEFDVKLMSGSVFVFYNRACNRVKCLFWDKNGFVIYHKRLERGKFKIDTENMSAVISQQQLDWLLAGLNFTLMNDFNQLDFDTIF